MGLPPPLCAGGTSNEHHPADGPSGHFGANSAYHGGDGKSLGKPELF
jgi:hypothetical protein